MPPLFQLGARMHSWLGLGVEVGGLGLGPMMMGTRVACCVVGGGAGRNAIRVPRGINGLLL